MAQENLASVAFTAQEEADLQTAIASIATIVQGKLQSLTPEERQQFGRVKYEKEVWIDKVKLQMDQNPSMIPTYLDKKEFDRDYDAHKILNGVITKLEQEFQKMVDTNLLLGYDLDTSALMFYRAIKTAANDNALGAKTVYEDLKQQFPGRKKPAPKP